MRNIKTFYYRLLLISFLFDLFIELKYFLLKKNIDTYITS